ncbi:MAG: catalase [Gemmatimonadaceae bacterium]|nr:catalase [Gemmatimonadaceae bacterium]
MASEDQPRDLSTTGESEAPAQPPLSETSGAQPDIYPHASDEAKSAIATATQAYVAQRDHNPDTPFEFGETNARTQHEGSTLPEPTPELSASTASETNASEKTGAAPSLGDAMNGSLSPRRVDATGRPLTTNHGVRIADNQHSLKAGLRGPTLLEDFILREKLTHFDHERIPERIVHARGSGAHGVFESYGDFSYLTKAAPFAATGKVTPVFTRFSTVAGERGSTDTARDARGFAVKFYTDEGVWDLVGNNSPVFFIQDAMKFPDFVHAVKPEPHNAMPQAASAHDTFWDFVSLMPESTHMLMWVMSDRAIPRSYRMMQGFGVNTYRLINADGDARFVKFHWTPKLGTHSLVWDEAVKLSGADPDFHRRDLWDAIESGAYPEWELGFQTFTEEEADGYSFDVLDATKLVPEELVPITPIGRMTLNRNPDNFFAETEQVAFCTAHVVPGIDFSNDPLLAGRIHSYLDTQISRLGGPNFHEIPINASIAPVHNNQRDGMHRQAVHHGRVSYEPNSLGGGCPFQAGKAGFSSFPEPIEASKLRGKPEKFAEHYIQARLFFDSQTPPEQRHIEAAFRFELSKVTVPAIRQRMLAGLVNVSPELAEAVATGLGMSVPDALPLALEMEVVPEVLLSPTLSLTARPGDGTIATRKVALLVADGIDADQVRAAQQSLAEYGAVSRLVAVRLGGVTASDGSTLDADLTMENTPSAAFDGIILPDGDDVVAALLRDAHTIDYVKDQYRHNKTLLVHPSSDAILKACGIPLTPVAGDDGLIRTGTEDDAGTIVDFAAALSAHRHFARETDPPTI